MPGLVFERTFRTGAMKVCPLVPIQQTKSQQTHLRLEKVFA